jgi:hypothetical protein
MSRTQGLELRRVIMPLFNFQSDTKKMKLTSSLWIRKMSLKEVKSIQRGHIGMINEFETPLVTHALETEISYEDRKVNETNELFNNVLLCFRLFKSGNIHQKVTLFKRKKGRGVRAFWSWKMIRYDPLRPYKFAKNEVSDFVELLNKMKSLGLSNRRDLDIPFHRFNKSYDDTLEEKFIDLMISIESLVRPSNDHIRKQVAIGISMLIGETSKERCDVKKDVDKAYDTRSRIVHGEIYRIDKEKERLYYRVEDYLRRAIIKMLD